MPDDEDGLSQLTRALLGSTPIQGGYDMPSALAASMTPKATEPDKGHWGSVSPAFISPAGIPEGLHLKDVEGHPGLSAYYGIEGERDMGNLIVRAPGGRLVSVEPQNLQPTQVPLDYLELLSQVNPYKPSK
jgi:hypothetical protein